MANYRRANVQFVDTTASFTDIRRIHSIKFIGDLDTAIAITPLLPSGSDDSGKMIWTRGGSQDTQGEPIDVLDSDLDIRAMDGIKVTVTGAASVYLYME